MFNDCFTQDQFVVRSLPGIQLARARPSPSFGLTQSNPKGISTQSPGSRGTSHPGSRPISKPNPNGIATFLRPRPLRLAQRPFPGYAARYPVGVGGLSACLPRVAPTSQPWAGGAESLWDSRNCPARIEDFPGRIPTKSWDSPPSWPRSGAYGPNCPSPLNPDSRVFTLH